MYVTMIVEKYTENPRDLKHRALLLLNVVSWSSLGVNQEREPYNGVANCQRWLFISEIETKAASFYYPSQKYVAVSLTSRCTICYQAKARCRYKSSEKKAETIDSRQPPLR